MNHEGTPHGVDRLRGKTTVEEVLEVATGFEAAARDFYTALIPRVSKRIRYLVEELAEEEQRHFDLFGALARYDEMEGIMKAELERPTTDSKFSDCLHLPELGEQPDDQAVLQYAMGREHTAMLHYGELAESAPEGPLRDVFRYLAKEETQHKLELEKLYYEIVHRGGGV